MIITNKSNKRHVDFVVNRAPRRMYIQSAYSLPTREKTVQEKRSLMKIPDHFRKMIVVGDNHGGWVDEEGIEIVGLYDFLLKPEVIEE